MASLKEIEEHSYTFPILMVYSLMITTCLCYSYCKSCCKERVYRLPKISLT